MSPLTTDYQTDHTLVKDTYPTYTGYEGFSFILDIERNFDLHSHIAWMKQNWHLSIYMALIYVVVIYSVRHLMTTRKPFRIRKIVLAWNIALSAFSIFGMCRAIPETVHLLQNYGLYTALCNSNQNSIMSFWCWAFTLSKAVELIETLFIVLMKRPVTPLQTIHHTLTLVSVWYYYIIQASIGRLTIVTNFTVHAFMYTYFALKTADIYVPEVFSKVITVIQILQMVVGLLLSILTFWYIVRGPVCSTPSTIPFINIFVYSLFCYLFVDFYMKRYGKTSRKKKDN